MRKTAKRKPATNQRKLRREELAAAIGSGIMLSDPVVQPDSDDQK